MNDNKALEGVQTLRDELLKIELLIATAVRLLDEGRVVDLAALEERTKRACDAALAIPRDELRPLVPAMEALVAALDALTSNLRERFDEIPTLSGLVGSDTAATAYSQTLKHFP